MENRVGQLEQMVAKHASDIDRLNKTTLTAHLLAQKATDGIGSLKSDLAEMKADVKDLLSFKDSIQGQLRLITAMTALVPIVLTGVVWVINHVR